MNHTELSDRVPARARMGASNLLFHIERTLEQAVERRPVDDAVAPVESKLVLIVGHDTNIAEVAALLRLHWNLDARKDDTPPGTEWHSNFAKRVLTPLSFISKR